jgi:hypothetical protein
MPLARIGDAVVLRGGRRPHEAEAPGECPRTQRCAIYPEVLHS